MGLAKELIKQMALTLDTDLIWYQKREYLISKMDELKNIPSEFAEWIKLYITHQGDNAAFNDVFDSLLRNNIEHLQDEYFSELSALAANLFLENKDNLAAQIFLFEAKHLSKLEKQYLPIELRNWYPIRYFNPEIEKTYDIQFPENYSNSKQLIPFIYKKVTTHLYSFGGKLDKILDPEINHIVTFDSIPDGLEISSLTSLTLGLDFNKHFHYQIERNEPIFYQHDENGIPKQLSEDMELDEEYPYDNSPIKPCFVHLEPTPKKYIQHPYHGNPFRIGGEPSWVQDVIPVICPTCKNQMQFLLQLDSLLPSDSQRGHDIEFGGSGSCYFYWCDKDRVSGSFWQGT